MCSQFCVDLRLPMSGSSLVLSGLQGVHSLQNLQPQWQCATNQSLTSTEIFCKHAIGSHKVDHFVTMMTLASSDQSIRSTKTFKPRHGSCLVKTLLEISFPEMCSKWSHLPAIASQTLQHKRAFCSNLPFLCVCLHSALAHIASLIGLQGNRK